MGILIRWFKRVYGAHPLHLLMLLASFALVGYVVSVLGFDTLWNHRVWWQAIGVWFAAAIIAHDLILFPAYALLDRILVEVTARIRTARVSPLNYIRVPLMGIGLSFLLFFPGIIRQGAATYHTATGGTQQQFLVRWLLLCAGMIALSALAYTARWVRAPDRRCPRQGRRTRARLRLTPTPRPKFRTVRKPSNGL